VIFVTVGTHHQPFERLLNVIGDLEQELVVQYGPGTPPSGVARAEAFMSFDTMLECFRAADKVITHAGVGSIICASREGHTPLVVPRLHELGEHVDDHQVELTRALEQRGRVIAVWEVEDLRQTIATAPSRQAPSQVEEPALCASVREALLSS
jgi:UDP-N-acetylglucosamine transferase subunit ALG13